MAVPHVLLSATLLLAALGTFGSPMLDCSAIPRPSHCRAAFKKLDCSATPRPRHCRAAFKKLDCSASAIPRPRHCRAAFKKLDCSASAIPRSRICRALPGREQVTSFSPATFFEEKYFWNKAHLWPFVLLLVFTPTIYRSIQDFYWTRQLNKHNAEAKEEDQEKRRLEEEEKEQQKVGRALHKAGLGHFAEKFLDDGWDDVSQFPVMTDDDLVELGLKGGHRNKFRRAFCM